MQCMCYAVVLLIVGLYSVIAQPPADVSASFAIDCRLVRCAPPACPNPVPPNPQIGQCCPTCFEDCRVRLCPQPQCSNPVIPPGRCCPICSGTCPPDRPPVSCTRNPCDGAQCPRFPTARCGYNNCGGCNARFFIGTVEVTSQCGTTPTDICSLPPISGTCTAFQTNWYYDRTSRQCQRFIYSGCQGNANRFVDFRSCLLACALTCPPGVPTVNCFANPCSVAECSAFPNAVCFSDFCGGCNARFFLPGGNEVTRFCTPCSIQGQVYQQCRPCPATCNNPNPICTRECRPGCGCPPGQIIDEANNRCVPPNQCPPRTCPIQGQVYQQCRPCPATCNNPNPICTRECRPGCGCPPGQIIDEANNRCVPPNQCPPRTCPIQGQVYQQCRPCPVTCNNRNVICTLECRPGCGCPPGQIIDEANNRCVPLNQCPPRTCPIQGQVYQQCRPCSITCSNPNVLCTLECRPGCGCPPGQIIDEANNRCVPRNQCPPRTCPIQGQVYQQCRPCSITCSNPNVICTLECRPGCGCPPGQIIDEANNRCVPRNQCPPGPPCPQTCSYFFCKSRPRSLCTLPSNTPREIPQCRACDVTVCQACYFSFTPLPVPSAPSVPTQCLQTEDNLCYQIWGSSVRRAYLQQYGPPQLAAGKQFRCWRPPCPLRG